MDIPGDNQLTYIYFTWLKKGPDWSISPYFLLPYISHFTSHYLCVCLAALCQQIFEQKKLFYKKHKKTALRKLEVYLYNLNLRCGIPLILYIYISQRVTKTYCIALVPFCTINEMKPHSGYISKWDMWSDSLNRISRHDDICDVIRLGHIYKE